MSSWNDLFKTYGLTGNPVIDSLLLTSIIPIICSYISNMTTILTKILMSLWDSFVDYISEKLRIKLFGNKLCVMIIDENDPLYNFLLQEIFVKDCLGNNKKKENVKFLQHIYDLIKKFKKYQFDKGYWKCFRRRQALKPNLCQTNEGNYYLDHDLYASADKNNQTPNSVTINKSPPIIKSIKTNDHIVTFKYFVSTKIIRIIVLNYSKNSNNVDENNKIAINLVNKLIMDQLDYKKITYQRLTFDFENDKLIEKLDELASTTCPQFIIDKLVKELNKNDQKEQETQKQTEINQDSEFINDLSDNKSLNGETVMVYGGTVGFSTNIINNQINDYSTYIKFEKNEHNAINMTQKDLETICGKKIITGEKVSEYSWSSYGNGKYPNIILAKTYKIFVFNGIYAILYRDYTSGGIKFIPRLILSRLGRSITALEVNQIINNLIMLSMRVKSYESVLPVIEYITVNKYEGGKWKQLNLEKRTLDTVYLPEKMLNDILNEIVVFMDKKKLYDKFQIYHKKGLLFYGPPGTGKTSLVRALACHFKIPIYIININDDCINDDSIIEIINTLPGTSEYKIILYEDIDSAFSDKEILAVESKNSIVESNYLVSETQCQQPQQPPQSLPQQQLSQPANNNNTNIVNDNSNTNNSNNSNNNNNKSVLMSQKTSMRKYLTYSGLLNALDGILSNQKGIITIMTTNYIGKLGSALIRPGRIDKAFELTYCVREQIVGMVLHMMEIYNSFMNIEVSQEHKDYLISKTNEFADRIVGCGIKPSKLQFYILKYIGNFDDIFNNFEELLVAQVND